MVRMSVADGELLEAADIQSFDTALVGTDAVVCSNARMVWALDTITLQETWSYGREGERYHDVARLGNVIFVVVSNTDSGKYGVIRLDAKTGNFKGNLVALTLPLIRGIGATQDSVVIVTSELDMMLETDQRMDFMMRLASHPDEGPRDTLSLVAVDAKASAGDAPLWLSLIHI